MSINTYNDDDESNRKSYELLIINLNAVLNSNWKQQQEIKSTNNTQLSLTLYRIGVYEKLKAGARSVAKVRIEMKTCHTEINANTALDLFCIQHNMSVFFSLALSLLSPRLYNNK